VQELREMADGGRQSGPASEVARQAADRADRFADWLAAREPGDLLDEVRSFARRRPGAFLAGAALAGVVVGRLTRGAVDAARSDSGPDVAPQGGYVRYGDRGPVLPYDAPLPGPAPTPPVLPPTAAPPVGGPVPPEFVEGTDPFPPVTPSAPRTVGEYAEEVGPPRHLRADDGLDGPFRSGPGDAR
jgi:hypothetical protein